MHVVVQGNSSQTSPPTFTILFTLLSSETQTTPIVIGAFYLIVPCAYLRTPRFDVPVARLLVAVLQVQVQVILSCTSYFNPRTACGRHQLRLGVTRYLVLRCLDSHTYIYLHHLASSRVIYTSSLDIIPLDSTRALAPLESSCSQNVSPSLSLFLSLLPHH